MLETAPLSEGPAPPWVDRLLAISALVGAVLLTVLLARVAPDPRGYDTHTALGMTACGWPKIYGKPCPTCGVTTAACWLVHLSPWKAFVTQPFGALAMAVVLAVGMYGAFSLAAGRSFLYPIVRMPVGRVVSGTVVVFLLGWLWKSETFVP